jgi:hypothetical protein
MMDPTSPTTPDHKGFMRLCLELAAVARSADARPYGVPTEPGHKEVSLAG